jgi:hypothetical protein
MLLLLTALAFQAAPIPDEALIQQALTDCPNRRRPNEELVRRLFEIEAEAKLPPVTRGLLAAAACHESSYNPNVHCGDDGASCGLVQLHGSHRKGLRRMGATGDDPRTDWPVATRYWLQRLKRGHRLAKRDCPGRGGYASRRAYLWASANKTATWRPKCGKSKCVDRIATTGSCLRRVCTRLVARCSTPWNGKSQHRAETKHWWRRRLWHAEARKQMEAGRWQTAPRTAGAHAAP